MFGENFESKKCSYTIRRAKFYKPEKSLKNYVEDGNLQLCVEENAPILDQPNTAIFKKLLNHHQQKQRGAVVPKIDADKAGFQQEFTDLQDTYQAMMSAKKVLKNAYEELVK